MFVFLETELNWSHNNRPDFYLMSLRKKFFLSWGWRFTKEEVMGAWHQIYGTSIDVFIWSNIFKTSSYETEKIEAIFFYSLCWPDSNLWKILSNFALHLLFVKIDVWFIWKKRTLGWVPPKNNECIFQKWATFLKTHLTISPSLSVHSKSSSLKGGMSTNKTYSYKFEVPVQKNNNSNLDWISATI